MRLAGIDVGAYNHILIQSAPPFKLSNAKRLFKKGFILLGSYDKMRGSLRGQAAGDVAGGHVREQGDRCGREYGSSDQKPLGKVFHWERLQ